MIPPAHRKVSLLAFAAVLAFLLGTAVYVFDRPAGTAYLLPAWLNLQGSGVRPFGAFGDLGALGAFGGVGASLPTLAHAFAFSLLTALVLPRGAGFAALACGGWALLETLFELGQHPSVSPLLARAIGERFNGIPVLDHLVPYFSGGVFDPVDVLFGLLGALAAFAVLRLAHAPEPGQRPPCPG